VRHGLEADGVAPEQMSSSVEARRAGDACRIEMRVQ
jgi:hypothetical protein